MLRNALPRLGDRLRRNHRGAAAPTLVGVLIDIAMITGQVTPAVDLEDELPEGQAAPRGGQRSDGGIEGGYRRSLLTFSDADPAHYVRVFDFIEANFRVEREVMNVGHVRSEDVVRVRSSHMWIGSLGRYRRSSPVGTIASVENYKRYYSPAVMPGSLPPGQSPLASIRGNSIAAGRR
jgi:hypothetical protein